jgi:hypothetical protein
MKGNRWSGPVLIGLVIALVAAGAAFANVALLGSTGEDERLGHFRPTATGFATTSGPGSTVRTGDTAATTRTAVAPPPPVTTSTDDDRDRTTTDDDHGGSDDDSGRGRGRGRGGGDDDD